VKRNLSVIIALLACLLILPLASCTFRKQSDDPAPDEQQSSSAVKEPGGESAQPGIFGDLSAEDLDGNTVNGSSFSGNKLTILNFWATWCGPCVSELPELQKVADYYDGQGVQLVGVLIDGLDESGKRSESVIGEAKDLLASSGCSYLNILPDSTLNERHINSMQYIPTTIFFDADGNAVYETVGSGTFESYQEMIDSVLADL